VRLFAISALAAIVATTLDSFGQWNPWTFGAAMLIMVINAVWDARNDR
jgi:uncharacterized membrane protein YbhN (UPF0104 family)